MSRSRIASKNVDMRKVQSFLIDAFNDYIAARVLFLAELPCEGSIFSSTAIEKYFKAIMAFRGNESHGHLKSAHWNAVKNFDPELFSELNKNFLELNRKCYRLRYTDDIPIGFNLVIASREFLAELDYTALMMQRSFSIENDGIPQKTAFHVSIESNDERLWSENHILLELDKHQFIYQAPQFVYEIRNVATEDLLEATYVTTGVPKISDFLRPGLVRDEKEMSYKLAFGNSYFKQL